MMRVGQAKHVEHCGLWYTFVCTPSITISMRHLNVCRIAASKSRDKHTIAYHTDHLNRATPLSSLAAGRTNPEAHKKDDPPREELGMCTLNGGTGNDRFFFNLTVRLKAMRASKSNCECN